MSLNLRPVWARIVRPTLLRTGLVLSLVAVSLPVAAESEFRAGDPPYLERDEVQAFIDEQVEAGRDREALEAMFDAADPQQRILDLISSPAEARPWKDYRPIFITDERIERGRDFMEEHGHWLKRAEDRFGVEQKIIASIIGVETYYGRNTGGFRVFDALVTLGFDYPPRSDFFRRELGEFLTLVDEEGLDPRETRGSYAGAMGRGQFISSSYRHYAVDFDGSGQRDLLNSWPDAIGSVANYFREHHWNRGEPVVAKARVEGDAHEALISRNYQARFDLDELAEHGIYPDEAVDEDGEYSFIRLAGDDGYEYYLGYPNFYVITRYNRSPLYAMAVHQLAEALAD
ncbi:lytic murein transglycosylase B [Thioalkalivibrio sp. ALMg11]|uniref:lytic murein transglycosylase B n=1 Tax=Thioalkalivibrio sp. ALMg11 TaxID=1158165 RepID=UPI000379118A|nr:lytic murein transglycosylase B [Thioalkalivibrio sp. ALMg11]